MEFVCGREEVRSAVGLHRIGSLVRSELHRCVLQKKEIQNSVGLWPLPVVICGCKCCHLVLQKFRDYVWQACKYMWGAKATSSLVTGITNEIL